MVNEVRCEEIPNDPFIAVHNGHYHRSGMGYRWHLSEPMSNKNQLRNPDESEIYSSNHRASRCGWIHGVVLR